MAALVITGVMLLIAAFMSVTVFIYANTPVMKTASPTFLQMIIWGCAGAYLTVLLYIGIPTDAQCAFQVILPPAAFGLIFGNLLVKTFRIWRIFGNRKMAPVAPSTMNLLITSFGVVCLEMVL